MTHRTIIFGDLHGCYDETMKLFATLKVRAEDHVIFLGDLVDRGPQSGECVELAMHREQVQGQPACILGNHEEKHLFYQDIERRKGRVEVQIGTHIETRMQLKPRHYDYFRRLPKFLRLPEYNAVCVHAGVWPGRPIEEQTDRHLLHIQSIRPYDKWGNPFQHKDSERSLWSSKVPADEEGWSFWTNFWQGSERVIFGHSVLNKPLVTDKVIGLDGGGCFGLELWALVLPTWEIVRQPCHGKHDPNDLKKRGNPDRKLHLIHGDVGTY